MKEEQAALLHASTRALCLVRGCKPLKREQFVSAATLTKMLLGRMFVAGKGATWLLFEAVKGVTSSV